MGSGALLPASQGLEIDDARIEAVDVESGRGRCSTSCRGLHGTRTKKKMHWLRRRFPLLLLGLLPALTWAQAWLPDRGTIGASFVHDDIENNDHFLPNGDELDVGHTRTFSDAITLAYSPSDRWLLSLGVPYVRSRYHGDHPHVGTNIDDGTYRGTFTDLRADLHFEAMENPFAFAPYVALIVPLHDYPTLGHAAPGRHLDERWIGFYAGKSLDRWLPRMYVQGQYDFAFVREVQNVSHNRSNAELEVGYFLNPKWSVRALGAWQRTHGGIDVPVPRINRYYPNHDRLAAERYLQVGGGVAFEWSPGSSAYLVYKTAVSGANGHRLNNGFTLGVAYSFSTLR